MDEGGRFEIYCRATYRGFESRPLRHFQPSPELFNGEMTEWTKVLAWNASVGQLTVGSNPTLSAISANSARPKVVVGSSWSGIREPRQDRKVATVSVPPRCGGARPSPGANFSVTGSA